MKNPAKYLLLEKALKAGVLCPESLLITEADVKQNQISNKIIKFLDKYPKNTTFIVRSAVDVEDNPEFSYAGHFWSSNEIVHSKVEETIHLAYKKNKNLQKTYTKCLEIHLILQPYIKANYGGVIFTPWKYFYEHFLVEISNEGVQKAVSGENSSTYLLSKTDIFNDIIPLTEEMQELKQILVETVNKLSDIFHFPIDIEWAYTDNHKLYILQIRPITVMPISIHPPNDDIIKKTEKHLQKISSDSWTYTGLSESMGILSPLTFSMFKELFIQSKPYLKRLGFKAENINFFAHLENGTVVVNKKKENEFYKQSSFFAPFLRTFNENKYKIEIKKFFDQITKIDNFSFPLLIIIFGYWQTANVFFKIHQKKMNYKDTLILSANEYELSFTNSHNKNFPIKNKTNNWFEIRNLCKALFLFELDKIKHKIKKNPSVVFLDWNDFINGRTNKKTQFESYQKLIKDSIFDIPVGGQNYEKNSMVCIAGNKEITDFTFVVKNPNMHSGTFPERCILIAPFFRNDWIMSMNSFSGIILENGSTLSHSAIVAREKKIPYFINVKDATEIFFDSKRITLNPKEKQIKTQC